ncbi:uncharacterized protein A1O9_04246 [Exophiala aquamarina CBS 119918]|uniref:Uncharacterized protein n=1 Tax=Exophiala aquamarina CBS 119918 TaxID=1182545 RepID=A0A072PI33_9EURO|nr:uncharacterized protein A1O9_04246 [Exophiala aquamarina CBS 119918]KEF59402.1 hypothetical protein A1O9_04246 [Exophiala aquamarina CBS 119918]
MSDTRIYSGFWTDHTRGSVAGTALTVSNQPGLYVIAFLALWVRLVGSHFWTILCFVFHQLRASPHPQDALHHQHQFLLRNSQSNIGTLWDLTKVAWYWKSSTRSFMRSFPLLALALFHAFLFTAAAFFSSQVASTSNLVLLERDAACGYLMFPNQLDTLDETKQATEWYIANKANAQWALSYVEQCYGSNASTSNSMCNTLVHRTLNLSSSTVDCPFPNATMCRDKAFQVDSGHLNSAEHLGINSLPRDSLDYRVVKTCAPIHHEGFYFYNSSGDAVSNDTDTQYYLNFGRYYSRQNNATFSFRRSELLYPSRAYRALDSVGSSFRPIDGLNRTDGDVTLVLLFNFAGYAEPVEDPWFLADDKTEYVSGATRYTSPSTISVMGCVEQHEFCLRPGNCSGLVGLEELGNYQIDTDRSKAQLSVARHMFNAIQYSTLTYTLAAVGTDLLKASSGMAGEQRTDHIGLPKDQWKQEILYWGQHSVTNLQRALQSYVKGPAPADSPYLAKPDEDLLKDFDPCAAQVIRDPNHYSINVFGLYFTLGLGLFVIVLNCSLPAIVSKLQSWSRTTSYRHQQYELDNAFQVQRLAYENLGLGRWTSLEKLVPVTQKGEKFGQPVRASNAPYHLRSFSQTPLISPYLGQRGLSYPPSQYSKVSQEEDPFQSPNYRPTHVP